MISLDTFKQKLDKIGYGVQYANNSTCVTGTLTNHNDLLLQISQKIPQNLEVGIEAAWKFSNKAYRLGLATKYNIFDNRSIKAKVDNNGNLSLGYTFPARDGKNIVQYQLSL